MCNRQAETLRRKLLDSTVPEASSSNVVVTRVSMTHQLATCVVPGRTAISVVVAEDCPEVPAQWTFAELLLNLHKSQNTERLLAKAREPDRMEQVHEYHSRVFPGEPLAQELKTKHEALEEGSKATMQPFYLKEKTVGTQMAFSWITWALAHARRTEDLRKPARDLLTGLVRHAVERVGSITFVVYAAGSHEESECTLQRGLCSFPAAALWSRSLQSRLHQSWRTFLAAGKVKSDFLRPSFADLLVFATDPDPGNSGHLLQPVVWNLIGQLAKWINEHVAELSLNPVSFSEGLQKNRMRQRLARTEAVKLAALHYLRENVSRSLLGLGCLR